jgi:hypothetical protein
LVGSIAIEKSGCVQVVEFVEMDDEELYVPDDVLEEARAARYLSDT